MLGPGARVGPYEIVALIGEGGMGQVYRGRDPRLGRDVAIKVLPADSAGDADAVARFEREARAIASLSHPNILAIFDVGRQNGAIYVVTELLDGETLRKRIEIAPVGWRKALEIGADIADGLAAAHARAVVHRDLKPENVIVTSEGRVKILDFGLAQTDPFLTAPDAGDLPTTKFQTDPGVIVGTLGYMAPEQLKGELVTASADIFSLGCILFEMVTAKRPFQRPSGAATIAAILTDDIPRQELNDAAPLELQRIIEGCVEKNPLHRFQSAKDLALTLRAIASSSAVMPADIVKSIARKSRRQSKTIDSIAVLPFENVGSDPGAEYLSEGITDGTINRLSQLPKLKVMARSTVYRFKGRGAPHQIDVQTVGRELRVRGVVTGRVKFVKDRLIVNAEMVDASDGAQLWGEQYNRPLADIVQLQEEMSNEIAEALRIKLTGAEKKRMRRKATTNSEAYQLYLKGRHQWNKRTEESLNRGIAFFRAAIDADPLFASAYSGLADSFVTLATNIPLPPREVMPKAKAAAEKAIETDENLAEAWASRAAVRWWFDWDWNGAEADYKRAIELNPNYATAHDGYAMLLCARGRFDEAIEQITHAADLDPLSLIIAVHAGWPHYFARNYDAAIRCFDKALELDANFIPAHGWRGMALGQEKRYTEALAAFERALAVDRIPILLAMLAHAHAIAGHRAEAESTLTALRYEALSRYISAYDIAVIHAGLGDLDAARGEIAKAREERAAWMVFYDVDPRLDPLRSPES
jgi:serine/threonine protein kinase/tetratricopeptide (TPR) repeat protein